MKIQMGIFILEPTTLELVEFNQDANLHSMVLLALDYISVETFLAMNKAYSTNENIPIEVYTYYLYLKQRYVTEYDTSQRTVEEIIRQAIASGKVNGYLLLGYRYPSQGGTIILYINNNGAYSMEKVQQPNGKFKIQRVPITNPNSSYYIQTHTSKTSKPTFSYYKIDEPV